MPRWQAEHAFHERHWLANTAEEQIRGQRISRKSLWSGSRGKQRSHFRSECKPFRRLRVVERLDSQRIAGKKKNRRRCIALAQIEQGERKHSAQFIQRVFPPFFPGVNENLRVGLCYKPVPAEDQALTLFFHLRGRKEGDTRAKHAVAQRKTRHSQPAICIPAGQKARREEENHGYPGKRKVKNRFTF